MVSLTRYMLLTYDKRVGWRWFWRCVCVNRVRIRRDSHLKHHVVVPPPPCYVYTGGLCTHTHTHIRTQTIQIFNHVHIICCVVQTHKHPTVSMTVQQFCVRWDTQTPCSSSRWITLHLAGLLAWRWVISSSLLHACEASLGWSETYATISHISEIGFSVWVYVCVRWCDDTTYDPYTHMTYASSEFSTTNLNRYLHKV